MKKEKIELFGTWTFVEDRHCGIMAYQFYPFYAEDTIKYFFADYDIEKIEVITFVEGPFSL